MSFEGLGFIEFEVDGETVSVDVDSDFDVDNIDDGMRTASARIAYFGAVYGAAIRHEKMVTARYRQWKAKRGADITEVEPKMAQTKVNQIVESEEMFIVHKDRQADAARNVEALRWIVEAFKVKASLLQSKGAMERAAFEATGMTTKVSTDPGAWDGTAEHKARIEKDEKAKEKKRTETARAAVSKTKAKASE